MTDKEQKAICITGCTGFVGRHIAHELCARGIRVRCLIRSTSDMTPLSGLDIEACQGDITDIASLEKALNNIETVVHLVAIIRQTGNATFEKINLGGTINLLNAAKEAGVKKIIYMSNMGAVPDQRFPLFYTKWRSEEEVRNSGISFTIMRPSVIFGRGDGFISVLASIIRKTPLVPVIGSGKTRFQPIFAEDVASCVARAVEGESTVNRVIPLGGPEYLTYEEITNLIIDRLKLRRLKLHIPVPLMHLASWAGEKLGLGLPVTPAQIAMLSRDNIDSLDTVEKIFGFKPVPLRERIDSILY